MKSLTGLPCPGCGASRALLCAIQGDMQGMFLLHPLLPFFIFLALLFVFQKLQNKTAAVLWKSQIFWLTAFWLITLTYLLRLFIFFPHTSPMQFNSNAALPRLWKAAQVLAQSLFQ